MTVLTGSSRHAKVFAILPFVAIVATMVLYSRMIFLFSTPIATLGPAVIVVGLISFIIMRPKRADLLFMFASLLYLIFLVMWLYAFELNTGLSGEWRSIGSFCGIFLVFPFVVLIRRMGRSATMKYFYFTCSFYVVIYVVFSAGHMYLSWFSDVVPGNIILRDGWRGSRLYANNAIINFALLNQLYALKMRKSTLLNIFLLLLTITAVWFSQSRMSTLFCLITLCAYLFVNPLNSFRLIRMFCYVYVPISILAIANSNRIGEFLAWLDPESLSLRILNLTAAQEFFAKNPILGMGIQGSSDFYYSYLGYPYFPEDLGGIGLASTFGLLGLLVFFALLLLALQGMKRAIASQDAQLLVVVHSGYFVILLSFVWPTLFYGDGSIVVSLLIALYICYRRDARKLYQRASIKAGVPNHAGRWI